MQGSLRLAFPDSGADSSRKMLVGRTPEFIGLGAQRAGTSWIYACLYEHPTVCVPVKEIHFFSRERNWPRGYEWYEGIFERCSPDATAGEFSTSYLADPTTPERIHRRYPEVRLVASLRNPVKRAYSNYMNDIMAGVVKAKTPFREALKEHPEYLEQGRYAAQLERYLQYFPRAQILILIYEDSLRDPLSFIRTIYRFIGVDSSFVPSMIDARINEGRVPRFAWLDYLLMKTSGLLRSRGLHGIWWLAKKASLGNRIRALNTRESFSKNRGPDLSDQEFLYGRFESSIEALEELLGRELGEWRI